jgi:Ulp1 family protease
MTPQVMGSPQPDQKASPRSTPYFNSRAIEERVLEYDDLTIYTSDLRSFQRNSWLTDNAIAFATTYLKNELLKDFVTFDIVVFEPSLIEIIKFSREDELPIKIDKMKFYFFPINDNSNPSISFGGSHWSLLIYDPCLSRFVYLDSMYMYPPTYVTKFVKKASSIMMLDNPAEVLNPICPKMTQNGNCGMFVIEYINVIFHRMLAGKQELYKFPQLSDEFISERRKYWLNTAYNLRKG